MALVAFAANSLLCRGALRPARIDAASFTLVRLASGAITLGAIERFRRGRVNGGNWLSAFALFAYAAAFSLAYRQLGTGVGALVLFGAVQLTMIAWTATHGERPSRRQWLGLAIAVAGLAVLTVPGAHAPPIAAASMMAIAGVAWGAYTLRGRGAKNAIATTADNFVRTLPFAVGFAFASWRSIAITPRGVGLAVASGALASGLGYSVWYTALPSLRGVEAGVVQLAVPVLAASGGIVLLGESLHVRLVAAAVFILVGIALVLAPRTKRVT